MKGTIQPKAPDNALVRGQLSLKAVKGYRRQGVRTAKIFKNLVLRPQGEKHAKKVHKPLLATPPLPYGHKFRFGTQNAQGMAETLKHQASLDLLKRRSLDVLFLTETHSTSYYNYRSQHHMVIVNGSKKDKYGGVTAIVHPAILPFLKDVVQHSSRIIQLTFSVSSGDMHLFGIYAPHNKLDFEKVKFPFWETLASITSRIPLPEPIYILGDFNVRLQGRKAGERHILGPHVYGKGPLSIDNNDTGNRFLYTQLLDHHALVDTLTFKQPNLLKHVTYRDKNPPPKTWSSFALDPIGWTQLWDKVEAMPCPEDDRLKVAGLIRTYITDDWPTTPPIPPTIDPYRFQSLDKVITRAQWLPSVHQVHSVLSEGFPSDHYLLEAVIKVKLKSRNARTPPPPKHDYSAVSLEQRNEFNKVLKKAYFNQEDTPSDAQMTRDPWDVYTDGSGSSGRCSATTPAGWGYVVITPQTQQTAYGPVQTEATSPMYLGATVGSNNTAELSAWMEAALFALSLNHKPAEITFHYDSKWMAQMVQGTSRPHRHKSMIKIARQIYWALQQTTQIKWRWVKGHSGDTHDEAADKAADSGKTLGTWEGGRASLPRMATPQNIQTPDVVGSQDP